jgi:hypothetical protein
MNAMPMNPVTNRPYSKNNPFLKVPPYKAKQLSWILNFTMLGLLFVEPLRMLGVAMTWLFVAMAVFVFFGMLVLGMRMTAFRYSKGEPYPVITPTELSRHIWFDLAVLCALLYSNQSFALIGYGLHILCYCWVSARMRKLNHVMAGVWEMDNSMGQRTGIT